MQKKLLLKAVPTLSLTFTPEQMKLAVKGRDISGTRSKRFTNLHILYLHKLKLFLPQTDWIPHRTEAPKRTVTRTRWLASNLPQPWPTTATTASSSITHPSRQSITVAGNCSTAAPTVTFAPSPRFPVPSYTHPGAVWALSFECSVSFYN